MKSRGPIAGLQNYLKESQKQVFSCECWNMFNNTFFTEHWRLTYIRKTTDQCSLKSLKNACDGIDFSAGIATLRCSL